VQIAIDAVRSSAHPHRFLGVTEQGLCAIVATRGNPDCHVILRGGQAGPNHDAASVHEVAKALAAAGLPARLMVDASHGNSAKDYRRQPLVAQDIAEQVGGGQRAIFGMMLESFLVDGRQELVPGQALHYGQSITDACMGWEMTVPVLQDLAKAVRSRRASG
jgi:3-deoxy-7-phosphoheptulonate synthase